MNVDSTRFLTPPLESEEVYPYRRVWRSIFREGILVFGVTGSVLILGPLIQEQLSDAATGLLRYILALLPAILWILFSWFPERQVLEPRVHLMSIAVVSGLAANAIGVPVIERFFQVDRWLPQSSAVLRIVGYSFTAGLVQEMLKYLVIRSLAWPGNLRVRQDGVAYGAAAAIGYLTVLNLVFLSNATATLEGTAFRVLSNYVYHMVCSALIGYALSEVKISNPHALHLTAFFTVSMTLTGIAIPLRSGLISPPLSLGVSQPRFLLGWAFQVGLFLLPLVVLVFLIGIADRRQEESRTITE